MGTRLYDRSRTVTDWVCPRKRYWNYEFKGKGIVPNTTALELFLGTTVHDGLAAIAHGVAIDDIAAAAWKETYNGIMEWDSQSSSEDATQFALEQAALVEGMLRGFRLHVWPQLMAEYPTIMAIEKEMQFNHNGLTFMSKPDLVLEGPDGPVYVEYKTTSSKKDSWINSWNTAVQLHSTMRAIRETLNVEPVGVIVQGLYKGWEAYGKQSSPFCYAYRRAGNPPFTKDEISYEYRAGFRRFPIWELPGGVAEWVARMPDEVLRDQFPRTPLIFINEALVDAFFAQRTTREMEIAMAMEMIKDAQTENDAEAVQQLLDTAFPQRFDQCIPTFGRPCIYRNLCFNKVADPLAQGYTFREPHHTPELEIADGHNGSSE